MSVYKRKGSKQTSKQRTLSRAICIKRGLIADETGGKIKT